MYPSPYSPFFTSGLLSEGSPFPDPPLVVRRRGSLPTDSPPNTLLPGAPRKQASTDEPSAFYFMLQPRRDNVQFRSFLSLDLAESQSLRSASLKRNVPSSSKLTPKSHRVLYSWIQEAPKRRQPPLRIRTSRESLRTFPSRKPAPSSALPHVPTPSDLPPQLPPLPFSAPMRLFSMHKSTHSAPSVYSSPSAHPPSAPPPPPACPARPASMSTTTSSRAATARQRTSSRSDALACLEGRAPAANRIPRTRARRNFMSMSDDDDDGLDEPQTPPARAAHEKEDVVFPCCSSDSDCASPYAPPASQAPRGHRSPAESWFPLASFMDMRDDDLSTWNWRSFIEVASVS